jgi:hypothetical protein
MAMKYARITVNKDPMEKIARCVPVYEIPVLRAIHGATAVQVIDEVERDLDPPAVEEEYERLQRLYRNHPERKQPYVEIVYGQPLSGGLATAINGATVATSARKRRAAEEAA